MPKLDRVYVDLSAISALEEQFRFSEDVLHACLNRAVAEFRAKGGNYPKTAKGTAFYNEIIAALRDNLAPCGYVGQSIRNVELVINEEINIALWFVRGDESVGDPKGSPESHRGRGVFLINLLGVRQREDVRTLDMFADLNDFEPQPKIKQKIWALLVYLNETENGLTVKLELGVPVSFNKAGIINYFYPRIILRDMIFDGAIIGETGASYNDDIDFDLPPAELRS